MRNNMHNRLWNLIILSMLQVVIFILKVLEQISIKGLGAPLDNLVEAVLIDVLEAEWDAASPFANAFFVEVGD